MSAQTNIEKVLRDLHVLLSKSEAYSKEPSKVIVDKQKMLDLLSNLNQCTYDMMEEYEMTARSRDKAEREFRKQGDKIVWDASRKAEDIYAASVMYTDEALNSIQDIMKETNESVKVLYEEMDKKLKERVGMVKANQSELKSQLQDLVDTEKYLKLIEERNREIEKEKAQKEGKDSGKKEPSIYANRQTEIKINKEYFEKMGIQQETIEPDEIPEEESIKEPVKEETRNRSEGFHKVWKNLTSGKK